MLRRHFLKLAGIGTAGLALAACAAPGSTPAGEGGAGAPDAAPVTITWSKAGLAFPSILVEQNGADRKTAITEKIYNANFMNGHLYGVPAAYYYGGTGGVIFREDLRAKYDAAMPTSEGGWPSLEPYLQAILDNESDMIPFVNVPTQSLVGYSRNRKGSTRLPIGRAFALLHSRR